MQDYEITTIPDELVDDEFGGTRGVISDADGELETVRLPFSDDYDEWERLADATLAECGWTRTSAWVSAGNVAISAQVTR